MHLCDSLEVIIIVASNTIYRLKSLECQSFIDPKVRINVPSKGSVLLFPQEV